MIMKALPAVIIVTVLLALAMATDLLLVNSARANPYFYGKNTPPPTGSKPPNISIFTPNSNAVFTSNSITLAFNASISKDTYMLTDVYYETDWQEGNTSTYHLDMTVPYSSFITEFSYNATLSGIPEGNHSIKVITNAIGVYVEGMTYHNFDIAGSSSVNFTIDTVPPVITVISLENKTMNTSDVPLSFTLNEQVSSTTYSLDGEVNETIVGNITLTGLSTGTHNITVYATDIAGNVGSSKTAVFMVAKPVSFPTNVVAASVATVAVVGTTLLIYFKRRKRQENVIINR